MRPRKVDKVNLVVSVFTAEPGLLNETVTRLSRQFGGIDFLSEPVDFTFTGYYEEEFGKGIKRRLVSFESLVMQDGLAEIKNFTNGLEDAAAAPDGRRRVNIDPGYVALPRFVLASCKNFSHRIYIGAGVYADLTLEYTGGGFKSLPWTYPDYKDAKIVSMLTRIRSRYALKLATGR